MKKKSPSRFSFPYPQIVFGFFLWFGPSSPLAVAQVSNENSGLEVGYSYHNDVSPALRDLPTLWPASPAKDSIEREMREANLNPQLPLTDHIDVPDPVVDHGLLGQLVPEVMPAPILNFDGMFNQCGCAPPDTNGAVGLTQYVENVNASYQVFDKTTGASVFGPATIQSIWSGFGGVCQSQGHGDPVVLYDHIDNRWLISQFAGGGITDQCIAISTTSDATGTYNRYGFHLGSNFYDYPHLGIWPDGYYQSNNVFNSAGTAFLGPQAFAYDRAKMLAGLPAAFVTPGITGGGTSFLPADFDGTFFPPSGTGNPFVSFPSGGTYKVRLFHADFVDPDNTTFSLVLPSPSAAGFTALCGGTRACVPQLGQGPSLDAIGDRLMFRLAYRKFADGHEAVVGNYTVSASSVAGIRWFEIRDVTTAPTTFQESTYQPDTTWRWMGSAAMDFMGNFAVGFSASDATINPQIRYAGRLATDPVNTLAQGEAHMFDGTGSQTGNGNRWGDYSAMTVDPVDDCTFWYAQEYMATTGGSWRTRIGNFKFPTCVATPHAAIITSSSSLTNEGCLPSNNVIDPGEVVTVSFCVQNAGSGATTNLVGTLRNTGGVVGASGPQTYGVVAVGATSCQPFTFSTVGACGDSVIATIHFQDGSTDLGDVTYTFTMGVPNTTNVSSQNFSGVTAPALPTGWTSTATGAEVAWVTSTTNPYSAPNDAFAPDSTAVGNSELVTPTINIPSGIHQLRFKNLYNMENGFDGMVLEISINGGTFGDIITAGGAFVAGGYNAAISTQFMSPIAGRQAWTGLSGGSGASPTYITTKVRLPGTASGQPIQLKWRAATDTGGAATGVSGVRIDDVSVAASFFDCCPAGVSPTPSPSATPTPSITPTPTPTPGAQALNLSTRMRGGAKIGIGGLIITGTAPKQVLLRGIGPSLANFGVPDPLADPVMELHGSLGFTTITNDNWGDTQRAAIKATGLAPTNELESAILATLDPGAYTAQVRGNIDGTGVGVGLVEAYDLDPPEGPSRLGNIATRAFVGTGGDIVIAGFVLGGNPATENVIVRGIGPSLTQFGVPDALADPTLELRDNNGTLLRADNDWQDDPAQAALLTSRGLAPTDPLESAIVATLPPGQYTALLAGRNSGTGVGLVEAYNLGGGGVVVPTPTPSPGGGTPSPAPTATATATATAGGPSPTPPPATPTPSPKLCVENFDGVTAPALPAGWVASNPDPGDGTMWATSTTSPESAPNDAFVADQDGISDKVLDRTTVNVTSGSATISWRNNFNTEFSGGIYWDGYVLEVSSPNISGGDFLDITDSHVGGSFVSGGYTGLIDSTANNPLAGRMAWSADSGGYIDTVVNLGSNLAGQTVTFRFRMGSDEATSAPGVRIDNIVFTGTSCP